jgi:predicted RNase H-like HicB family nuclease
MSESPRYPAEVFYSDEDGGYIAIAPDLPGSSAFGETQEEALHELQDAIKAWIGAAKKAGNPIPPPSARPHAELPSGKVLARLPKTLHAQLIERADRDGTSLNTCLVMLLSQALAEKNSAQRDMPQPFSRGLRRSLIADAWGAFVTDHHHTSAEAQVTMDSTAANAVGTLARMMIVERVKGSPSATQRSSGRGPVLNLMSLPAGKPVVIVDDQNG